MGEVPFKKCEYGELVRNLVSGNLGIPQNVMTSEGTRKILVGCFREKLNERLTAAKLLELIVHELSLTSRSTVPRIVENHVEFRRSIVGTNNRSSAMFQ